MFSHNNSWHKVLFGPYESQAKLIFSQIFALIWIKMFLWRIDVQTHFKAQSCCCWRQCFLWFGSVLSDVITWSDVCMCVCVCLRTWRFLCTCCDTCVCSAGSTASLWWRTALNSALLILSRSPSHMPSSPSSLTWVIAQSNRSLMRLTCNQSEVISSVYADQNMVAHSRCDAAHHPFSHLCYQVRTHF